MAGSALMIHSSIAIETDDGIREIQLCFGDITSTSNQRCLNDIDEDGEQVEFTPEQEINDVIMISAFQGDYSATPTSVIGALKRNLGISVRDLARDKEEDLRKHFHCWWSKPLPGGLPYKQLMCFETPWSRNFRHPAELVGDVFRCLVAMFQNQEKTVITPLLSTGDQHFSPGRMMRSLLEGAVNWIRAGLPMKRMKIVIYSRNPSNNQSSYKNDDVVKIFEEFKKKIEKSHERKKKKKEKLAEPKVQYDIYMSFNEKDEAKVKEIADLMMSYKSDIRIFREQQSLCADKAWQDDIYNVMVQCRRVVTFLSPAYLESPHCVEQYNMALCSKRAMQRDLLAPFYIETIDNMPTYMALVQYADCRNRDGTNDKMLLSIQAFIAVFETTVKLSVLKPLTLHYDVFISYSHRNTEKATRFLDGLKAVTKSRELSIFFDKTELRTGSSWQQQLYNALDNAATIITLLSPNYIQSQVCQEEYNLALMKHIAVSHAESDLVPVMIEPMETIPVDFSRVKIIDGTKNYEGTIMRVSRAVDIKHSMNSKNTDVFSVLEMPINADSVLRRNRKNIFEELFSVEKNGIRCKDATSDDTSEEPTGFNSLMQLEWDLDEIEANMKEPEDKLSKWEDLKDVTLKSSKNSEKPTEDKNREKGQPLPVYDVAFICSDISYGAFLNKLFQTKAPELKTNFGKVSDSEELASLDNAKIIVALLSSNFVNSGKHVDEFHIALARHRKSSGKPVLYCVQIGEIPRWPTCFHIVPCRISVLDLLWKELINEHNTKETFLFPKSLRQAAGLLLNEYNSRLSFEAMLALAAAADDIIKILEQPESGDGGNQAVPLMNIAYLDALTRGDEYAQKPVPIDKVLREPREKSQYIPADQDKTDFVSTEVEIHQCPTGPRPSLATQRKVFIVPRNEPETGSSAGGSTGKTQSAHPQMNNGGSNSDGRSKSCAIL